eukprot:4486662-Prymnesium_polylepis.1
MACEWRANAARCHVDVARVATAAPDGSRVNQNKGHRPTRSSSGGRRPATHTHSTQPVVCSQHC